jgi:hypothetical protein
MSKSKYKLTNLFLPARGRESLLQNESFHETLKNSDKSKVEQIIYSIYHFVFVMDFQGMPKICLEMKQRIFYILNIDEIQGSVSCYV